MKTNPKMRSKLLTLASFALLGGVVMGTSSCGKIGSKSIDDYFFTVKGADGDLEVTFCDKGAAIYSIKYKGEYMTYHPKNKEVFLRDDYYYGKVLGRVAGRIKDGDLKIDDKHYQLEVNETSGKKHNSLHGGTHGLATKYFNRFVRKDDVGGYTHVEFSYISPHMEAGYPGNLNVKLTYMIPQNEDKIHLEIEAKADKKTPIDITTHPYFRLGNSGTIKDHKLVIPTPEMAKYDASAGDQTVLGKAAVSGSPYDFNTNEENAHTIGERIEKAKELDPVSGGYDNIWVSEDAGTTLDNITLFNNKYKLFVQWVGDANPNAIIMYSNCYPHTGDEMNPSGKDELYAGISVEPYVFFTKNDLSPIMYDAGKTFTSNIIYTFSTIS